jgi:CRISPR-associated protein Cas2
MIKAQRDYFLVVAFDVSSDRRRRKLTKVLEEYGSRVNFSVFECLVSAAEAVELKRKIALCMKARKDNILVYSLCKNCIDKRVSILGATEEEGVVKIL